MFEFKSLINSDLKLRASISSVEHLDFDIKNNDDLISLQINDEHISTISMKTLNDKQNNSKENENRELFEINSLRKFSSSSILLSMMNRSSNIIVRQFLILCRVIKFSTNQLRKYLKLIQIVID